MFEIQSRTKFTRNGITLGGVTTLSAGAIAEFDESFSAGSLILNEAIDVSALKAILVVADVDCLLEFNGDGAPQFVAVNLAAGEPFAWNNRSGLDNPFGSTDVESIAVSSDPVPVRFQMMILTDPTP